MEETKASKVFRLKLSGPQVGERVLVEAGPYDKSKGLDITYEGIVTGVDVSNPRYDYVLLIEKIDGRSHTGVIYVDRQAIIKIL